MEEQEQLLQTWVGKQIVMETSQGQGGRSGIVATLRQFGPYGVVVSFGYSAGGQEEMRETMLAHVHTECLATSELTKSGVTRLRLMANSHIATYPPRYFL
jgi:hypothetical protein